MRQLRYLRLAVALIALLAAQGAALYAQQLLQPVDLRVVDDNSMPGVRTRLQFNVAEPGEVGKRHQFVLMLAQGHLDALGKEFRPAPAQIYRDKNGGSFVVEAMLPQPGDWSAVIASVHAEADTALYSNIVHLSRRAPHSIRFTSVEAPERAVLGELYTARFTASSSNDEAVTYSLESPVGDMSIDGATGELRWTPEDLGVYSVVVRASAGGITASHIAYVAVYRCARPAVLSGTVTSSDGELLKEGAVLLYNIYFLGKDTVRPNMQPTHVGAVINGSYSVEADEGDYYVQFMGHKHVSEFYNNASTMDQAEVVVLSCGTESSLDAELEAMPKPVEYTVSGSVVDASTGLGIMGALVEFHASADVVDTCLVRDVPNGRPIMGRFMARTDQDGNYAVRLPGNQRYIAMAFAMPRNTGAYLTEFWEETADPSEASVIALTESRQGVNFTLEQMPVYQNGIAGTVVDTRNESVESAVVAYRVGSGKGAASYSARSEDGSFRLSNLEPGSYVLLALPRNGVHMPGFYRSGEVASLRWEEATVIEVTAEGISASHVITLGRIEGVRNFGRIRGVVRRGFGGLVSGKRDGATPLGAEAVPGAIVTVLDVGGKASSYMLAEADGGFELPAGKGTLVVSKFGFATLSEPIQIEDGVVSDHTVELAPQSATGVEEGAETALRLWPNPAATEVRASVPGSASVRLWLYTTSGALMMQTSAEGDTASMDVSALPSGAYVVRVDAAGSTVAVRPLVINR